MNLGQEPEVHRKSPDHLRGLESKKGLKCTEILQATNNNMYMVKGDRNQLHLGLMA